MGGKYWVRPVNWKTTIFQKILQFFIRILIFQKTLFGKKNITEFTEGTHYFAS